MIFYIIWITIVNKSSENKTFQKYLMTFPYLQMPHFLDWLCTVKKVCAIFFDVKFKCLNFKIQSLNFKRRSCWKMELFSHFFLHFEHTFFLVRNLFCYTVEIKKCACTRLKKFCSIEKFSWVKNSALKYHFDANITLRILHRKITLK